MLFRGVFQNSLTLVLLFLLLKIMQDFEKNIREKIRVSIFAQNLVNIRLDKIVDLM